MFNKYLYHLPRDQAAIKACGDLLRRPNHDPSSPNLTWLNLVSAENNKKFIIM